MYITFFTKQKKHQITWDEILTNPYMSLNDFPALPRKKITKIVNEEYAKKLWSKYEGSIYPFYPSTNNPELIKNIKTEEHYTTFYIPKKSNPKKKRKIDAPDMFIATIQRQYKDLIENHMYVQTHKAAHAYVKEKSTVTALQQHQKNNSKWYLQIDLKDFFNSINGIWLKKMLLEVYPFKFIPETELDNLIKVSLLNGTLPQGSILSPTLTNLCMVPIDYEITETLHNYNKHHYVYTRYADDITISSKQKFNPKEIIEIIKNIFNKWNVPFKINNDKTRFGSAAGRNYHLGLIINKDNQISAGHERNQILKAKIHNFCITGHYWSTHDVQKMLGIISYYKSFEPNYVDKILTKYGEKFNMDIIQEARNKIANGI